MVFLLGEGRMRGRTMPGANLGRSGSVRTELANVVTPDLCFPSDFGITREDERLFDHQDHCGQCKMFFVILS